MAERQWDVVVIGGGPAGYTAAIRAVQHGLRPLLVERAELGGTCLNRGCIPSKALIHCAKVWQQVRHAERFGVIVSGACKDWQGMRAWADRTVATLRRGLQTLLRHHGVTVWRGEAQPVSEHELRLTLPDGTVQTVTTHATIWATGSSPNMLPHHPDAPVFTEEQALFWDALPDRLVVIGGGASGVELAWLFNALGVRVTLLEMLPRLLPVMDAEIADALADALQRQGIVVRTSVKVERIDATNGRALVHCSDGTQLDADAVICAVGRKPNSEPLRPLGVTLNADGTVAVNAWQQTSAPTAFAVGDVVRGGGTAHGGMAEGERAAKAVAHWLHRRTLPPPPEPLVVPFCVYCEPQAVRMGLTEADARKGGYEVVISRFAWRACGAAVVTGETEGFVKIVADKKTERILGVHILGTDAANLNGEAGALVAHGQTVGRAVTLVRQHPSLSEGLGEALWALLGIPLHSAHRSERRRP
ncbi:Dihydrolipoyl dehydrogenase [bacterium HR17]|uniref:Dihydrolipoyl dehydrogenase n=1 Tax=Candidatus Fervidibacter japonicus TaxID=2035412 RepID=A0A2H5XBJ5_9BACT|nr:Dihydrolipoyl dehydrogenase [bacterium HR17]